MRIRVKSSISARGGRRILRLRSPSELLPSRPGEASAVTYTSSSAMSSPRGPSCSIGSGRPSMLSAVTMVGRPADRCRSARRPGSMARPLLQALVGGLCRGDPQHAAAGPALPRLLRPAQRSASGSTPMTAAIVALIDQPRRLLRPRSCAPASGHPASAQIEAGQSLGLSGLPGVPLRRALPGAEADVSRRSPASSSC